MYSEAISVERGTLKLSVIGAGLVFGDDDVLTKRCYKATLRCYRQHGVIYKLKRDEYLRIFRTENDSWKVQFLLAQ